MARKKRLRRGVFEPVFSIRDVMSILEVDRYVVRKWLECEVIPRSDWFRLPGGAIRIRKRAIDKLKDGG